MKIFTKRWAVVRGVDTRKRIEAYLPERYKIAAFVAAEQVALISGRDVAGWTLDEYVLPRLASGLMYGTEVTNLKELGRELS